MSPESKSRLARSYRYQGRCHLEKRVSFYISRTIYFTIIICYTDNSYKKNEALENEPEISVVTARTK